MVLYPDNVKREERAKELLNQCGEFQARMVMAKDALEEAALAANDAIYRAYKKVEPATPPPEDWNQKTQLTDQTIKNVEIANWVMNISGATASIFISTKVYKFLKPMLESANCFKQTAKQAADMMTEKVAEGLTKEAAEAAVKEFSDKAAEGLVKMGGAAATETSVSLTGRVVSTVLSGAGGLIAGAVVSVLVDLLVEAVTGDIERQKLRKTIKEAYEMRVTLKLLDMQYEQLKEELMATVNAFNALLAVPGLIDVQNKTTLDNLVNTLVDQNASKLNTITDETAKEELAALDKRMSSWTDEDTLGA